MMPRAKDNWKMINDYNWFEVEIWHRTKYNHLLILLQRETSFKNPVVFYDQNAITWMAIW